MGPTPTAAPVAGGMPSPLAEARPFHKAARRHVPSFRSPQSLPARGTVRLRRENVLSSPPFWGDAQVTDDDSIGCSHPPFPQGRAGRLPSLAGSAVHYGEARAQETASGEAEQGSFRAGPRAQAVCMPIPPCGVASLGRLSLGRLGRGPRARRPCHVRGRTQTHPSCTGPSPTGLFLWPHGMAARP